MTRHGDPPTKFQGTLVGKGHGGGKGKAHRLGNAWDAWSVELSKTLGRDIALFHGTLNVAFDDDDGLRRMLGGLGAPLLVDRRGKTSRAPYYFHEVRMYHSLQEEEITAFLWYHEKMKRRGIIYKPRGKKGRLEFAAERIQAKYDEPVSVDFSRALPDADNPGVEADRNA